MSRNIALQYLKNGELVEAKKTLADALHSARRIGDDAEAIRCSEEELNVLFTMREYANCIKVANKLLAIHPTSSVALRWKGKAHFALKQAEEAFQSFVLQHFHNPTPESFSIANVAADAVKSKFKQLGTLGRIKMYREIFWDPASELCSPIPSKESPLSDEELYDFVDHSLFPSRMTEEECALDFDQDLPPHLLLLGRILLSSELYERLAYSREFEKAKIHPQFVDLCRRMLVDMTGRQPRLTDAYFANKQSLGLVILMRAAFLGNVQAAILLSQELVRRANLPSSFAASASASRRRAHEQKISSSLSGAAAIAAVEQSLLRRRLAHLAKYWIQYGALLGTDSAAYIPCARLLQTGCPIGYNVDIPQSLFWFRKASSVGIIEASGELGLCFCYGAGGTLQDIDRGMELLRNAAAMGHHGSQVHIASLFAFGLKDKDDPKYVRPEGSAPLKSFPTNPIQARFWQLAAGKSHAAKNNGVSSDDDMSHFPTMPGMPGSSSTSSPAGSNSGTPLNSARPFTAGGSNSNSGSSQRIDRIDMLLGEMLDKQAKPKPSINLEKLKSDCLH